MPTIDDYASAADTVKERLPDDLRSYADDVDPKEIAAYAKDTKAVLSDPEKAVLNFVKSYLTSFVGAAAGTAIATAVGAGIGTLIPVPLVGTLCGAAFGAFCDKIIGDFTRARVDSNLDANGKVIVELDALIVDWANPAADYFADFDRDPLRKLHTPGPDGFVSLWMFAVDRWCKTEKRVPHPGAKEDAGEMRARFVNEYVAALDAHYTHQTRRAQAHGQVTVGAIQLAEQRAALAGISLAPSLVTAIAPKPKTAAQLLAAAGVNLSSSLVAAIAPATLDDFVRFYLGQGPSPRADT